MDNISLLRNKIDEIDEKLLYLLNKRAAYAIEIGKIKVQRNMNICDPEREKTIIEHVRKKNYGPLSGDSVQRLFEVLIEESKRLEDLSDT